MPVRVIFRGLMLFQLRETETNGRKLYAYLINKPGLTVGGHPHDHDAEVQILTGDEPETARHPKRLKREATLEIEVQGKKGVSPSSSFDNHVPDLAVIAEATPAYRDTAMCDPNRDLIQNVVTVDAGIIRVREVVAWDEGGYPLSGEPADGERAISPAVAKFMGSSVRGHLASEIVVEIENAEAVVLKCAHDGNFRGPKKASANPKDPHVPAGTLEILVSNFEPASPVPTPWGLDFQWLFEAAGYPEVELGGDEFEAWVDSGTAYNKKLFEKERAMFLRGPNRSEGRPFPYMESVDSITNLEALKPTEPDRAIQRPLTNYPNWWVCVFAFVATGYTVMYTESIKQPDGTVVTREWILVPGALAKKRAAMKRAAKKAVLKKAAAKKPAAKKPAAKKAGAKKTAPKKKRGR